jgi:hypothetical protein
VARRLSAAAVVARIQARPRAAQRDRPVMTIHGADARVARALLTRERTPGRIKRAKREGMKT